MGLKSLKKMTDEQLSDDLPFMLVLYRFIRGAGYSVVSTQRFFPLVKSLRVIC